MSKKLLWALALTCGTASALDGAHQYKYSAKTSGVTHLLIIDHWNVDKQNIPTLEYRYEQHSNSCTFTLSGRGPADAQPINGRLEVVVDEIEDDNGNTLPATITFNDAKNNSVITVPASGKYTNAGLIIRYTSKQRAQACDKGSDSGLWLTLHK